MAALLALPAAMTFAHQGCLGGHAAVAIRLFFFALVLASCGSHPICSVATCPGCCDNTGACQAGTQRSACGENGATCAVCGGDQTCTLGACYSAGSQTGAGGGSAANGGGAGGGFSGSGGGGGFSSSGGGGFSSSGGGGFSSSGGGGFSSSGGGGFSSSGGGGFSSSGGGNFGTGGGGFGTGGGTSGTGGGFVGGPCVNTTLTCTNADGQGHYACVDSATTDGFPANAPTCTSDADCPSNYQCWSSSTKSACLQVCTAS
jgi:hypothetical protein